MLFFDQIDYHLIFLWFRLLPFLVSHHRNQLKNKLVKGDWVKKDAIVIDVGINKTDKGIVGDVAFDEVSKVAKALTPVPGGVGPMTIACLLRNTIECFKRSQI